ncbi:MAG: alpha/beta hydrolase family protein [Jatrophihabitans sp.]|uniref:alpha/beta hydrolase family protein n=1 Tax=Jatrophihabitans sp. TaxID=1932789 RepID=UPI003F7D790C
MTDPRPVVLETSDGIRLAATYWPADGDATGVGCIVAHGFTMHSQRPDVQRICRALASHGLAVLSPDFRGHGDSGGLVTAGAEEIHDIAAAVAWLRDDGFAQVAVLGWSMGGTAVLRHAGLGGDADAVVSVSAPGRWFERGTRPMRLLHLAFETGIGRCVARLLFGTRISSAGWATVPESPAEVAGAIAPRPLLIVHGELDKYLPVAHADELAAAAPSADVWIEPGMGHAEVATSPELAARIADWVVAHCAPHRAALDEGVCDDGRRD